MNRYIHSFIPAISIAPLQVLYHSEALPTTARGYCIGVSCQSAQATAGKGLAQGPYMAARAEVEPTTLWLKVIDSTKAPSRPTYSTMTLGMLIPVLANQISVVENRFKTGFGFTGLHRNLNFKPS